jgi:hypothetical protein
VGVDNATAGSVAIGKLVVLSVGVETAGAEQPARKTRLINKLNMVFCTDPLNIYL